MFYVKEPKIIETIVKEMKSQAEKDIKPYIEHIQTINKELNRIEKKKKLNLELEFNDKIDTETLSERLSFLREKEKELKNKKLLLQEKLEQLETNNMINADEIQSIFNKFAILFKDADIEQKKILLHSIIEEIHVNYAKNIKNRTIKQIKFYYEPQDVPELVAQIKQNNFAISDDTAPP